MKYDLKFLVRDVDRYGRVRFYLRKGKMPKIKLAGAPGEPGFLDAYQEALARVAPKKKDNRPQDGTLGWLVHEFEGTYAFTRLGPREQRTRHLQLELMLNEETVPGNGRHFRDCPISKFTREHVIVLRDRKMHEVDEKTKKVSPKPNAANHRVTQLRVIFTWGMDERAAFVKKNVAADVKLVSIKTDGYHTWTEDEVAQYEERHPVGTMARLALDLMLYTGMRRSDAMQVRPSDLVQFKNPETGSPETWLSFVPKKTSGTTGKALKLPLLDVLRQSIAATPHGLQTLLVTGYGKPFSSSNSFGNWFKDRGAEAGLPLFCTAHGLRKAGAVRSAENGATAKQMMAIFGWDLIRMAEHYIKKAEQKKLAGAAMHTLSHKS